MTDSEIRSKVREMRTMANELERELNDRLSGFNKREGYSIDDVWNYGRLEVARDATKQISQLCAFNLCI